MRKKGADWGTVLFISSFKIMWIAIIIPVLYWSTTIAFSVLFHYFLNYMNMLAENKH